MKTIRILGAHEGDRTVKRIARYGLHYGWHIKKTYFGRKVARDLYVVVPDGFDESKIYGRKRL